MRNLVSLPLLACLLLSITGVVAEDDRPNILILMADDWSWPHAGFLGDKVVKTPTFDALARQGIVFENAFVSSPSCTPSRFAIVSGQWHWRLGEGANLGGSLAKDVPVYPDLLKAAGYHIGFSRKGAAPSKHIYRGNDPFGPRFKSFKEFLKGQNPGQPFCFWYGAGEPHRPYRAGTGVEQGLNSAAVKVPGCLPDTETVRSDLCDYYEAIQRFDRASGEMLKQLKDSGELENTLIIVSGDNGMPFPRCKATLYDTGTRIPLIMSWPRGFKSGRRITDFVSLTDLAPTILELGKVEIPKMMTGQSLLPILKSNKSGQVDARRDFVLTGMERHVYPYPARAIRTQDFLYIKNFQPDRWPKGETKNPTPTIDFTDGSWPTFPGAFSYNIDPSPTKQHLLDHRRDAEIKPFYDLACGRRPDEELYDLKNDPQQLENVALEIKYAEPRQRLSQQLKQELRESNDSRFVQADNGTSLLKPVRSWSLDAVTSKGLKQKAGSPTKAAGVVGQSLMLNGSSLLEVEDSTELTHQDRGFTLVAWFNPYTLNRDQQMIVVKNRYALNEREWGVMVDKDGRLRLYVYQKGWKTVEAKTALKVGNWHQVGVVLRESHAELWLNGELADQVKLSQPIPKTKAPLTFGGVDDNGWIRQTFRGALDQVQLFDHPLTTKEMGSLYTPVTTTHAIPEDVRPFQLWDEAAPLPLASEMPVLKGVKFHVIKKWDKTSDGYTFLHGVNLAWHNGKLYASFGHNKGAENTVTEEAQYRVSDDGGKTWSEIRVMDAGGKDNLAVSHGVFLSHKGRLWAFHGAYSNKMENIHTRAYSLDEETGKWLPHGVVIKHGFWPMNQPVRMSDGNWIMPGISAGPYSNNRVFAAAVAISHGDDFTKWDYVAIPTSQGIQRMWGESAIFLDGQRVYNIARYGGRAQALVAVSNDYGRHWTPSQTSNLPMATSKPAAGTLSTGQRYLICTTAKNNGGKRSPLTIALTEPGKNVFKKVFVIRHARHDNQPGESADRLSLAYPCAIEHDGYLYVGYSNNGGRRGNLNSAELAIIPIKELETK